MKRLAWNTTAEEPEPGIGEAGTLLAVMAAALALRLWLLRVHPHIEADGYFYLKIAESFQRAGSPFHPIFHPIYPLLIALTQPFVGDAERAARLISALAGTLTIVPSAVMARTLFGPRVAVGTAILVAAHPLLVLASTYVLTEATYSFLITSAAALTVRALHLGSGWHMGAVGLLLGGAYLARPEGLLLVPVLSLWWLASPRSAAPAAAMRLAWAGVGAAAAAAVALPYLLYLRGQWGTWTLSGKVQHLIPLDSEAAAGSTSLWVLVAHLPDTLLRYGRNLFVADKYVLPSLFPAAVMILLALGIFGERLQGRPLRGTLFLLSLWLPTLVVPLFHIETRVFVPYLPAALVLAARGACYLGGVLAPAGSSGVGRSPASQRGMWAVLAVVTVALLPHALRPILTPEPRGQVYRVAAAWIANHAPDVRRIMDRKPYVAYYTGRVFEPIPPRGGVEQAVAVARKQGVDLLVVDARLVREDRPGVERLTTPELAPPELVLLRRFDVAGEPPLLLYRLRPE